MQFSDYNVYVDESGDHRLVKINPIHPVFVLAFCMFKKESYGSTLVPAMQRLKFEFWGHDAVVLHGHEIRKEHGDFNILRKAETRAAFLDRLNGVIDAADFTVVAAIIDKARHVKQYKDPADPYEIALAFCMERLQLFLKERQQGETLTHLL